MQATTSYHVLTHLKFSTHGTFWIGFFMAIKDDKSMLHGSHEQ